jgi:hypothetical protein
MMSVIEFAFVVAGLGLICWAIVAPDRGVGQRTTAAGVGFLALLAALLLGMSRDDDRDHWGQS